MQYVIILELWSCSSSLESLFPLTVLSTNQKTESQPFCGIENFHVVGFKNTRIHTHSFLLFYNERIVFLFLYYLQARWTVGKLNCPFCGARLGGFNFVSTPKCSCGQRAAVYLSKSRTDYQPAQAGRLMRPSPKYLSHPRVRSGGDSEALLTGGAFKNRNRRLLNMAQKNNGSGRLTEALCLEVRSTCVQMEKEKLLFKASDSKYQLFIPKLVPGRCTRRASHRKSQSLDLSFSEKLTLLPTFYEIHSQTTTCPSLNGAQPEDLSDLPLESSKNSCSFHIASSFDPNMLLHRFSAAPRETQTQRGGELQSGLGASAVCPDHASSNGLAFLMDLPSTGRHTLEASDQEEHLPPLDFLCSGSFPLGAIHQRLSKRERSKLKSLRRKQRRHERWLQKQVIFEKNLLKVKFYIVNVDAWGGANFEYLYKKLVLIIFLK